jgi:hypothetical protein
MTTRDTLAHAQADAIAHLVGHHGIIGVGRDNDALVFFVEDWQRAQPIVRRWCDASDLTDDAIAIRHLAARRATPASTHEA